MKKNLFVFIFFFFWGLYGQSPLGKKMQKAYEEGDFEQLQNLTELAIKKKDLEKAEGYLFEALRIVHSEDMPENHSFLVLRYLGKALRKKQKSILYQHYTSYLLEIKTLTNSTRRSLTFSIWNKKPWC